jgi:uncharacterized membrane protein
MQQASLESFVKTVARESWDLFRRDALTYVLAAALVSVVSVLTLGLAAGALFVGFVGLVRRGARGEAVHVSELFQGLEHFWSSLAATVLIVIAVGVGMAMLVVPGLLVVLFTAFAFHVIAYEKLGAVDAIRRSAAIVRTSFLETLVLVILFSIMQSLGGSIVLGVLLTAPLGMIGLTLGFQQLSARVPESLRPPPGVVVR